MPRPSATSSPDSFDQYRLFGSRKMTGSGSEIARRSSVYASSGLEGVTTFSPAVWT
jgi:hypothetical protein